MYDLDNLTLKELQDLRNKVDRAITGFEERKRREAIVAVEAAAREHGFSLNDLTGGAKLPGRRGGKVAPKYANPQNVEQTWTGRGRRPAWVQDALASGKSLDDLAI